MRARRAHRVARRTSSGGRLWSRRGLFAHERGDPAQRVRVGLRQDAVPEVEDVPAPTSRLAEHGARPFRHDRERRETDRGVEIALDGASVADAPPSLGQTDTPIDAHSLADTRGEPEELGITREEIDP